MKMRTIWMAMAVVLAGGCGGGSTADSSGAAEPPAPAPAEAEPAPELAPAEPAAEPAGDPLQAAVDAPGRKAEDKARDADRKPYETMQFFGIAPGMKVAELMTVGGYYGELLARAVGPQGKIYLHNNKVATEKFAEPELSKRLEQPDLAHVTKLVTELEEPGLPAGELDTVLMILFYHDTYWLKTDRKRMNAAVFAALKPGGVYGIIDHQTAKGAGAKQAEKLHRVEKDLVIKEVKAAGFVLDAESELLSRPEDDHKKNVFDKSIRGKTDQFILRFRKPN
ncbi:MAG TPA: SAM-dependent methyltransferase [Kofleriaceae bacterium]|nr:SAM-dependent methyltransferase [Kofleriaceae bacterium]